MLALQKKLIRLKYLAIAGRSGVYGPRTTQAVMAFQGWRGLTRDGVAGPATFRALAKASIPRPWSRTVRHMEVHKAKQVLLLIAKGVVVRAIHVSTASPGHVTSFGHFTIYRKEAMSWSKPFQSGCHWPRTSPVDTRSTSTPTCPATRPHTAACESPREMPASSGRGQRWALASPSADPLS